MATPIVNQRRLRGVEEVQPIWAGPSKEPQKQRRWLRVKRWVRRLMGAAPYA